LVWRHRLLRGQHGCVLRLADPQGIRLVVMGMWKGLFLLPPPADHSIIGTMLFAPRSC
jgi:hypothetical protein